MSAFSLSSCGRAGLRNVRSLDRVIWRKPGRLLSRLLTGAAPAHRTYLVSGHNVTMADLVEVVRSIIPGARIEFPTPERKPSYPDNSRAVTEFGWAITGLEETVRAHIDGVRAEAGLRTSLEPKR